MDQQPPVIDYRNPTTRNPWESAGRFFLGLILGSAVSFVVWYLGWETLDKNAGIGQMALFIVPGSKLAVGIPALCIRRWRSFGAGVLVSLPVGFLIFFGSCASHFHM